ncbi:MAG: hypothetical protein M1830_010472 [Pleopsidium flavum]|nr:MAG: hypothetical protein M1830_010472 [Pleopsidium flavum]
MSTARTHFEETGSSVAWTPMSPPTRPVISPAKTTSAAGSNHTDKRLSLSFPMTQGGGHIFTRHTPSSSASTMPIMTTSSVISVDNLVPPRDSGSFLTALAAQERRVLELKEDLQRAEADLAHLKSQWAMHEATRKRDEMRHIEQLQTLGMPPSNVDGSEEETNGTLRMSKELERRKAMYAGTSPAKRKVFSGSRHTRTLSLLSSNSTNNSTNNYRQPIPPGKELYQPESRRIQSARLARSSTMPEVIGKPDGEMKENASGNRHSTRGPPREAILRTGKQIAVDFREGLWTFIEDLRQATVGDEGISGTESRTISASPSEAAKRPSSKASLRGQDGRTLVRRPSKDVATRARSKVFVDDAALIDVGGAFWTDPGTGYARAKAPSPSPSPLQRTSQEEGSIEDDSWEHWDSPSAKVHSLRWSSSTLPSDLEASLSIHRSSPQTSISSTDQTPCQSRLLSTSKRDEIPWPSLTKLSPSNLKRTASTLMTEWERSLTPPAEDDTKKAFYQDPHLQ